MGVGRPDRVVAPERAVAPELAVDRERRALARSLARCSLVRWSLALAVALVGGCESPDLAGFQIEQLDFEQLTRDVADGPVRVEIELLPEWAESRAREVERRRPHHLRDDERVESQAVSPGFAHLVVDDECRGTLALALADVQVRFDARTRFVDQRGTRIECIDFVSRIEAYVALGQEPQITALRRPPSVPQAPTDPVFIARELRIDDEDHDGDQRPEIEINVTGANLAYCVEAAEVPPDCRGALRVLGTIVTIDGSTELEGSDPEPRPEVRFGGLVQAVDLEAGWLRLQNGMMLQLVEGSEIEWGMASDVIRSFEDVDRAMGAGRLVEAHGRGVIVSTDPVRVWIQEIELEIERHRPRNDFRDVIELQGDVLAADRTEAFVTLPFETRLRLTEVSSVDGDLPSLDHVGAAIGAGRAVRANARVVVEEIRRPTLVTRADRVTFAPEEDAPEEDAPEEDALE